MSSADLPKTKQIALEDLIALNDEIASLVRAGVPLELGLSGFASSVSGRLRRLTDGLAERMKAGASLSAAIEAESHHFPAVYRAVVAAGLKTGRLPDALESLTEFARSLSEIRKRMALALVYPAIIVIVAYVLFVAFLVVLVPEFEEMFELFHLQNSFGLELLKWLSQTVRYWAIPLPVALLVVWLLSGLVRRMMRLVIGPRNSSRAPGSWFPGIGRMVANYQRANFARLLAILIEHDVPLDEALILAAEATGSTRTIADTARIAGDIRSGKSLSESLKSRTGFPPFMTWMIGASTDRDGLAASLNQLDELYRRRAQFQADWFRTALPVVATMAIGGGAVLLYGLALFLPLTEIYRNMSQ